MTFLFKTWHIMCRTWLSCSEHDCHDLNMTGHVLHTSVMFWTWASMRHVRNMTVMFRTRLSCSEHDTHVSCSEDDTHDCHVLTMTVMFQRFPSCSGTWKTCSGTWKSCSGFSCSAWFEQALNMLNITNLKRDLNDGSWTPWQFEHEISRVMFKACSAPPNMLWTCWTCWTWLVMFEHDHLPGTWRSIGGKS